MPELSPEQLAEKKAKRAARNRRYRKTSGGKLAAARATYKFLYGIDVEEYYARINSQNNKCAACGVETESLHLDHCHATKKIRDLLCTNCNTALGHVKDSPEILRALANYLEHHTDA